MVDTGQGGRPTIFPNFFIILSLLKFVFEGVGWRRGKWLRAFLQKKLRQISVPVPVRSVLVFVRVFVFGWPCARLVIVCSSFCVAGRWV